MKKYFFFSLLLCSTLCAYLFLTNIKASECWPEPSVGCITDANVEADDKGTLHSEGAGTSAEYVKAAAIGCGLVACPDSTGKVPPKQAQRSVVNQMANVMGKVYDTPPANLALWVDQTGQSLGFVPRKTYAQGTGFTGLLPILKVWTLFRNMAYLLLALCLIAIGFMIMFRRRIDPHTVVNIQNALPRVIIALILITFSYAIAAFLIEVMYIVLFGVITLLSSTLGSSVTDLSGVYVTGDLGALMGRMLAPLSAVDSGLALPGVGIAVGLVAGGNPIGAIIGGILGLVANAFAGVVSGVGANGLSLGSVVGGAGIGIITPIIWLLFAIALFFFTFRIFFMLLGAYLQILISVIIGPLQILMNVFPGSNAFMSWLMGLVSNLATFVIVAVVLMLDAIIISNIGGGAGQKLWAPPFIGSVDQNLLQMIIGVGGIMIIPSIVNGFKEMIKAQSALPVGVGAAGAIGSPVGKAMEAVQTVASIEHITGKHLPLPWRKGGGHGGGGGDHAG